MFGTSLAVLIKREKEKEKATTHTIIIPVPLVAMVEAVKKSESV